MRIAILAALILVGCAQMTRDIARGDQVLADIANHQLEQIRIHREAVR